MIYLEINSINFLLLKIAYENFYFLLKNFLIVASITDGKYLLSILNISANPYFLELFQLIEQVPLWFFPLSAVQ